MAPRTIADARFALDQAVGLSDADRRRCEAEITAALHQATETATVLMDERVHHVAGLRESALADLCAVRDDFAALAAEAKATAMTAADYTAQFNDLAARHRHAAQAITRTEEALAFVEPVEDDPAGYGDALYAKFPLTRPDFSF